MRNSALLPRRRYSFQTPDLSLTGTGMTVSLENEEIVIENDVKARLFNLRWVESKGRLPM